jgi:spore maturation protein CgeB
MQIALFCHSLLSDWNHGNAHFLRGIATELHARGHVVRAFESRHAWSAASLEAEHGRAALECCVDHYPALDVMRYDDDFDLDEAIDAADLVLVHEWNPPELVQHIGAHRRRHRYVLLFHDSHHGSFSEPHRLGGYDLADYDGVLAFGEVIRQRYLRAGWTRRAWTWHEAADVRVFYPRRAETAKRDLVWIGNWGDEERTAEIGEFLLDPVRQLRLHGSVHGVRYPAQAIAMLSAADLRYEGWLPNFRVPEAYARHRVTVHVPRRPYALSLPGIPTIRPFEALACGIPLVTAPWDDTDGLFSPGKDYLVASNGAAMVRHLRDVLHDHALAASLADHGRRTIMARHTCAHRVDELLAIVDALRPISATSAVRTLQA